MDGAGHGCGVWGATVTVDDYSTFNAVTTVPSRLHARFGTTQ